MFVRSLTKNVTEVEVDSVYPNWVEKGFQRKVQRRTVVLVSCLGFGKVLTLLSFTTHFVGFFCFHFPLHIRRKETADCFEFNSLCFLRVTWGLLSNSSALFVSEVQDRSTPTSISAGSGLYSDASTFSAFPSPFAAYDCDSSAMSSMRRDNGWRDSGSWRQYPP